MCQSTGSTSEATFGSFGSSHRRVFQLTVCTIGVCASYVTYGILQERLVASVQFGASFVLLTQCATNVCVVLSLSLIKLAMSFSSTYRSSQSASYPDHVHHHRLPHGLLGITAACYAAAMVCSNESIQYVSYPVAVLCKSCKLIPTMVVGQFVNKRNYSRTEWMAAGSICLGICVFQLSRRRQLINSTTATDYSSVLFGLLLLLGSLTMDGILNACQSLVKTAKNRRTPNAMETMLYVNLYALVLLLPWCVSTGQWHAGLRVFLEDHHGTSPATTNKKSLSSLIVLNGTVAVGQIFIFLTLTWFSPVTTTLITTTRKFVTIALSVWWYGHQISTMQWGAMAMVFGGLYVAILTTVRQKGNDHNEHRENNNTRESKKKV